MPNQHGNPDDDNVHLLAEMRALKPRVEKLLDAIEARAEEQGAWKATVKGDIQILQKWCDEQKESERQRWHDEQKKRLDDDRERRNRSLTIILSLLGSIIAIIIAVVKK
jgi:hypothetical protein